MTTDIIGTRFRELERRIRKLEVREAYERSEDLPPAISDRVLLFYADGSSFAQFSSIGEACAAASAGDTIWALSGTFAENVTIPDGVEVVGQGLHNTVIDGAVTVGWDATLRDCQVTGTITNNGYLVDVLNGQQFFVARGGPSDYSWTRMRLFHEFESRNVFWGYNAGNFSHSINAQFNVGIGGEVLQDLTSGEYNVAVGYHAGQKVTTGIWNTALGGNALSALTTGSDNTAVGRSAGGSLLDGDQNVAVGAFSLLNATAGTGNVAIGYDAGRNLEDGDYNTAIGPEAMSRASDGSFNVGIGYQALRWVNNPLSEYNVGVGPWALFSLEYGSDNVAVGDMALYSLTTGDYNVAIGDYALGSVTGYSEKNTAVGHMAGGETTAGYGTFVGSEAGEDVTSGPGNVMIGYMAGANAVATGQHNTYIGFQAGAGWAGWGDPSGDVSKSIAIGYRAAVTASNTAVIGGIGEAAVDIVSGAYAASAKLHLIKTDEQLRLAYDADNYAQFTVGNTGDLTITPSGEDLLITGSLDVSNEIRGNVVMEWINTPTYKYFQHWANITQSAGLIDGGEITATSYAIKAADDVANTFKIAGDVTAYFTNGVVFTVSGSTGNDGDYTTVGDSIYDAEDDDTTITVANVPDGTDDGSIADGRVDVGAVKAMVKRTDDEIDGVIAFIDCPAVTHLALTDEKVNWIYGTSAGTIEVTDDETSINRMTEFIIGRVFRSGTELHILQSGGYLYNTLQRLHKRIRDARRVERVSGAIIADEGSLHFSLTEGVLYSGLERFTTDAFDTSGADRFRAWYHDGAGNWTFTARDQATIDNVNYDTGTGLAPLAPNRYGIHWVFLHHDGHVDTVYGRDSYKLYDAEIAPLPDIPDICSEFATLVAKIIVFKNDTELTAVESAFEVLFPTTTPVHHDDLAGVTANQHHTQVHDVVGGDHTLTGPALSVVGATAPNTIGLLTPSANPGANSALLKSDANGYLQLERLGIGMAPTNALDVTGNIGVTGTVDGVDIAGLKASYDAHDHSAGDPTQVDHANLTNVLADQHHAPVTLGAGSDPALSLVGQELTLADVLTPAEHTAIGDDAPHHPQSHVLSGPDHTESGLTVGHVLRATGATTFAWGAIQAGDLPSHNHVEADITDLDHTDVDAIHDNVAGEIVLVPEKTTPASADVLLIEDSEAGNAKKRVQIGNLPGGGTVAHDVVGAYHTVTGSALQVVGLTATDTLGLLTPSADPGAASALLKTDADGYLQLERLGIGMAPVNALDVTGAVGISDSLNIGPTALDPNVHLQVSFADADSKMLLLENTSSTVARYPGFTVADYTGTTTSHPLCALMTARGTKALPTAVPGGDTAGAFIFYAHTGTAAREVARVAAKTGPNFAEADREGRLQLLTNDGVGSWASQVVLQVTETRQTQLPATGSAAGLLIGGDAQWYRSAADVMHTPDSVVVEGGLNLGTATGAGAGDIKVSGDIVIGNTSLASSATGQFVSQTTNASHAAGEIITLPLNHGLVFVESSSAGRCALFRLDISAQVIVSGDTARFSTTKDTANKINVYWEDFAIKVQNGYSTTRSYTIHAWGR